MNGDEIVQACDWHSDKTMTLSKLVTINSWGNGFSNFSANLRVVTIKLLQLTQFTSPNLSIYLNFLPLWCTHFKTNHACTDNLYREAYASLYSSLSLWGAVVQLIKLTWITFSWCSYKRSDVVAKSMYTSWKINIKYMLHIDNFA